MTLSQEVTMQYFAERDEELAELRSRVLEQQQLHHTKLIALFKSFGADAAVMSHRRPIGLSWLVPVGSELLSRPGLNPLNREIGESDTNEYHNYVPNRRLKAGRDIAARLSTFKTYDGSAALVEALGAADRWMPGAHSGSKTGAAIYHAVAGINKDKVVLKVPTTSDAPFAAPVGMVQIKHSEFIALTEE